MCNRPTPIQRVETCLKNYRVEMKVTKTEISLDKSHFDGRQSLVLYFEGDIIRPKRTRAIDEWVRAVSNLLKLYPELSNMLELDSEISNNQVKVLGLKMK